MKNKTPPPATGARTKIKSLSIPGDCNTVILFTDQDKVEKVKAWYEKIRKGSLIQ